MRAAADGEAAAGNAYGVLPRTATSGGDAAPFPWEAVIHAGLHLLRLPASDFWALTPVEFFAMTGGLKPRGGAIGRGGLEELMRTFPDQPVDEVG